MEILKVQTVPSSVCSASPETFSVTPVRAFIWTLEDQSEKAPPTLMSNQWICCPFAPTDVPNPTTFTTTFIRKHSVILSNNLQLDRSILWFTDLQKMAAAQARLQTWLGPWRGPVSGPFAIMDIIPRLHRSVHVQTTNKNSPLQNCFNVWLIN